MKITAIKTFMARWGSRPRGLIKVETDEGLYGWGEAYSIGPDLSVEPIADYIFEMIKGEDPRRIEYLMLKLTQQFRFPPGGTGLAVISAIDHALWDISGKAANLPVYMLLGGSVRDRVRVYHGIGGRDGKETAEQAHKLNEAWGFTAFKISPYRLDPDAARWGRICSEAARYFEDIRKHTPEEWEFAFDPHAKIFEPIRALQLANALAPYDPYFYEEPLRPEHLPAWTRLRAQMQVPLATGESLYNRFEFLELVAAQGADIIQPDVCVCGGLLEMRKIAAIAEAHYVDVAPHNPMSPLATAVNVQFAAATPNFLVLEYILPGNLEWKGWVDEPYLPKNGYLELRNRPGLGVEINEKAITGNEYIHWQRTTPIRPDGSTGYI
ncbi:MAG: mandelate racemase/muconate lactonizing enzyme family protein [Candidatus Latescibacteria bacterium]|nr:mandelate racemase/muconate lactonizing enzyme family protein [Candidatus Latescibacterota bacterium]